jgi:hypothetical protein
MNLVLRNQDGLEAFLQSSGIPTSTWGRGGTKTVEHLFAELESGEMTMELRDGVLTRVIAVACVTVYYNQDTFPNAKGTLRLCEEKQVFKDGQPPRVRGFGRIAEKVRPGELAIDAARRALAEELGIEEEIVLTKSSDTEIFPPEMSKSYPGLTTVRIEETFMTFLPAHLYKPEGYVEEQQDKTTYFVWKLVFPD